MPEDKATAIMLLAFGGADSVENVEPFVKNVLKGRGASPEIIEKTRERYRLIGGRSPLLDITGAQAKALDEVLKKDGHAYRFYVGMRYWHPYIKDTMERMKADGVKKALGVVMTPFNSRAAIAGYHEDVDAARAALGGAPRVEFVREWHVKPLFIEAIASNVLGELGHFRSKDDCLVIFSCHSLPMTVLEGDPYEMMIQQSAEKVAAKTGVKYRVAYQSRGAGPRQWMGPSVEEVIDEASRAGKKGVIVVPFGFVADHVETLYDIDILFKDYAGARGLVFRRTASLNVNEKLMRLLADIIENHTEMDSRLGRG